MKEKEPAIEPALNILIIEDNPGDVFLVKDMILSSGISFVLDHATTLKEASSLFFDKDFDIVLLDLGLPDSLGLETLGKFRKINKKLPVVVMTGLDDQLIALEALRQGAQDYIVKNRLSADIIFRTINYSIERKRIQDYHVITAQRFSILSNATAALNECKDIPSIFNLICYNLSILPEKARAIGFEFHDPGLVRISGTKWLGPLTKKIRSLTGFDLSESTFQQNGNADYLNTIFKDNKVTQLQGGLNALFNGALSMSSCVELEKLLNAWFVYTIGLYQLKIFYGGFVILSEKAITRDDINIIEAISNQTALNIHRRTIESDLRKSEDQYKNLSMELELKVKERTADLESLNKKLQFELEVRVQAEKALKESEKQLKELNATKDKFFNIVAHDLKNPFTSLLGSSELLFQNINILNREDISQLAVILNDSAKSGYAILQNLLDWSRSQTGMLKINPEVFNLKSLIDEIISNLELFSSNKQITINSEVGEQIIIYGDKNMTNTILRNLISNALKFSYRNNQIIIGAETGKNVVEICVRDFGTGIPKEDIPNLFRIDSKFSAPGTENELGTGLGLKLCREFVEKQGGKIWVESEESKGSCFRFTISSPGG